ncbi:MAG: hypothetical protein AAFO76_12390 [Cyanobacteria bacterium J06607_15]
MATIKTDNSLNNCLSSCPRVGSVFSISYQVDERSTSFFTAIANQQKPIV